MPRPDSIAGDVLEIEIPAARAVRVAGEGDCDAPGVKPLVAGAASPWTQLNDGGEEIRDTSAMRTETFFTSALRTNHFADRSSNSAGRSISKTNRHGKSAETCMRCARV